MMSVIDKLRAHVEAFETAKQRHPVGLQVAIKEAIRELEDQQTEIELLRMEVSHWKDQAFRRI